MENGSGKRLWAILGGCVGLIAVVLVIVLAVGGSDDSTDDRASDSTTTITSATTIDDGGASSDDGTGSNGGDRDNGEPGTGVGGDAQGTAGSDGDSGTARGNDALNSEAQGDGHSGPGGASVAGGGSDGGNTGSVTSGSSHPTGPGGTGPNVGSQPTTPTRPVTTINRSTTTLPRSTTTQPRSTTTRPDNPTTTRPSNPTTTVPGRVPPGPDPAHRATAGWRFEPSTLLLAPGESTEVELVHADPNGVDDDGLPPSDPTLTLSDAGVASVDPIGEGRFRVTAKSKIGFTAVGADVPYGDLNVSLLVTVATTKANVTKIADDSVVWPRADKDELAPVRDFSLPYQSATGVGPFTWQHIKDLALTPASDAADTGMPEYRFALVVKDLSLADGDLVVSSGDSSVLGRVMSVETHDVDGHALSLVSIELIAPENLFREANVDFATRDLIDVGAVAPPVEPGPLLPVPKPKAKAASSAGVGVGGNSLFSNVAKQLALLADGGDDDGPGVGQCEITGGANLISITPKFSAGVGDSKSILPTFDALFSVTNDGSAMIQVVSGMTGSLKASLEIKATLSGTAEMKCGLAKLGDWKLPAPAPIGPFLTLETQPTLFATFGMTGSGGPVFTYKKECSATYNFTLGFRYNPLGDGFTNLSSVNNSGGCPDGTTSVSDGVGGPSGASAQIEGSVGLKVETPMNIRIGGAVMEKMAKFFGEEDFGLIKMFTGEGGLVGKVAWANTSSVLDATETPAVAELSASLAFGVDIDPLEWVLAKIGNKAKGQASVEAPKLELDPPLPLAQAFRGISKGASDPEITVDGDKVTNGVAIGDQLDINAVTKASTMAALGGLAAPFETSKLTAYVKKDGNFEHLTDVDRDSLTQPSDREAGPTIEAHFMVTKDVCDKLGGKELEVAVVSTSSLFGLDTPGYVAGFKLKCVDPDIRWDPADVEVENHDKGTATGKSQLQILDPGAGNSTFTYSLTEDTDWLTVKGADGSNTMHYVDAVQVAGKPHDAMVADVKIEVDCDAVGDRIATTSITGKLDAPDYGKELTKDLFITADCRTHYTKVTPKEIFETGGPATIEYSADQKGESWSLPGAEPSSGTFPSDTGGVVAVNFKFEGAKPKCDETIPETRTKASLTSKYAVGEYVELVIRKKKGSPCPPPKKPPTCTGNCGIATANGDPHMTSFDGARFDMQTPGDYRYLVPDPADPDATGPQLQVRHGYYVSTTNHARIIEAAAVDYGGHRVEAYLRPNESILIDGVAHTWDESLALELRSDFQLSLSNGQLDMNVDGVAYTLVSNRFTGELRSYLDLTVRAPLNASYRGIFGSPDGNAANDFAKPDGTMISLAQAQAGGIDFFTFTESWRVTDIADSLFSIASDTFTDSPAPFDIDAIMPYVNQVRTAFADLAPVCGGLSGLEPTSYEVVSIAVELAAGTPLAEAMNNTCAYQLAGNVTSVLQQFGPGLGGVSLHITAPGLNPCDVVTDASGNFSCTATPDLTALRAGGVPNGSPTFRYVVTHPVSGNVMIDTTRTSSSKATFGSSTYLAATLSTPNRADGSVDLTGTVTQAGVPVANQVLWLTVTEWDADGKRIFADYHHFTTDAQGVYNVIRATHPLATKLVLQVDVAGDVYTKTVDLTQPASGEVRLDIDHNPPVVTFDGVWQGVPGSSVRLRGFNAAGDVVVDTTRLATVTDGRWSLTYTFPVSVVRVEATALVSDYATDNPVLVTPVDDGASTKTFDVIFNPVMAHVHGTVHLDGAVPNVALPVHVEAYDVSGVRVANLWRYTTPNSATGAYSLDAEAPQSTTRLVVTMQPTTAASTWQIADIGAAPGVIDVPLSADLHRDVVDISGLLHENGDAPSGAVPVTVSMRNSTGQELGTVTQNLTAAADGTVTWSGPVTLPFGTSQLHVTAAFHPGAGGSLSQDLPIAAGQTTATFDLNLVMRVVTMNITATSKDGPFPTWFQLYWMDGNVMVGSAESTATITPDAAGHATATFVKPMNVDNVFIYANGFDDRWVESTFTFGADPNVSIDLDLRPRQVQLAGSVTRGGAPAPAGSRTVKLVALDGSSSEIAKSVVDTTIEVGADGTYATDLNLPEWDTSWSATPSQWRLIVTGSDSQPHNIDLGAVPRGATNVDGDFVEVDTVPLTVETELFPASAVRLSAIAWVPGSLTMDLSEGKWTETPIPPASVTVTPDGTGRSTLSTNVAPDVTFVRITEPGGASRVIQLPNPGAANSISTAVDDPTGEIPSYMFDFQDGPMAVEGDGGDPNGGNYCPGQPYPMVMNVKVTANFTSGSSSKTRIIGTFLVFPDITTGRYHLDLPTLNWADLGEATPPDDYLLEYSAHDSYSIWSVGAYGSTTIPADQFGPGKPTWEFTPSFGCAM